MKDDKFIEDFTNTFDKASLNYENVLVLGDLNYNMQDREKSSPLQLVRQRKLGLHYNQYVTYLIIVT